MIFKTVLATALAVTALAGHPRHETALGGDGNWSGYLSCQAYDGQDCGGGFFTTSTATFTVPAVDCADSPSGSYADLWTGLDGYLTAELEAAGVITYCASPGSQATYQPFYMLEQDDPVRGTMTVDPGDTVQVTVSLLANYPDAVQFRIVDENSGGVWAPKRTCDSADCWGYGAETMVSQQVLGTGIPLPLADLADFGSVDMFNVGDAYAFGPVGWITDSPQSVYQFYLENFEGGQDTVGPLSGASFEVTAG